MPDPNEERLKKLKEAWNRTLIRFPELKQYGDSPWGESGTIPTNIVSHVRRLSETPTPTPDQVPAPVPQQQPDTTRRDGLAGKAQSAWQTMRGWTKPEQEYDPTVKTELPKPVDWGQRFETLGEGFRKFAGIASPVIGPATTELVRGSQAEPEPRGPDELKALYLARRLLEPTGLPEMFQVSDEVRGPATGWFAAHGLEGPGSEAVKARAKELRDQGIGPFMAYDQALRETRKLGEISGLQSTVADVATSPEELIPGIGFAGGVTKALAKPALAATKQVTKQVAKQLPEQAKKTGPFRGDIDQIKSDITTNSPDLEDIRGQKNAKSLLAAKEKEIHDRVETIFMDRFDPKTRAVKELAEEDAAYINYHLGKDLPLSPFKPEPLPKVDVPEIPVFTGRFAQPPPVVRYKEDIDDIRNIWEDVSVKDPELLSEQKFFNEQSVDDLLGAVTTTPGRVGNILAGLPGAGRIFGRTVVSGRTKDIKFGFKPVDRSEIARTADIEGVGYRLFQALQDGKSSGRLARFGEDIFDIDETGMLSLTDGSAKMFDEVMENPGEYINRITPREYQWIKDAHQLTKQLAENYQAVSGKKLIVDKANREYYWPRFTIKDDKLNFAKPSGEKIGAKQTPEYNRLFTNIEEGIEKGVNYNTSPQAILSLYSGALDKMIRDQIFIKRWIKKGIGKDPTEVKGRPFIPEWQQKRGLDEQIVLEPEAIKELSGPLGMPKGFLRPVEMVAAVPKFIVTGLFDTGQFMIQGLTLLATSPTRWAQATKGAVGEIFKPDNYNKMLNSPKYKKILNDASSHGMDVNALVEYLDAIAKPGPFQRGLSKIPVVRTLAERFQKGFQAYMGLGRLHMYEAMSDFIKAGKTGINPKTGLQYTTKEIDDQLFQAARQADSLLGGTNTKALGISATQRQVENGILFFAPRYTRAVYGVVGHALGTGMTADFTRRTLGKMAFGAILIVAGLNGLSGTARGKSRTQIAQDIEDSLNPRKGAKFLSVKVGNQYIGVGGGFRAMARLITSLFSEEEWRRSMEDPSTSNKILRNPLVMGFRSKAPIVTGTLIDTIDEQDYVCLLYTSDAADE